MTHGSRPTRLASGFIAHVFALAALLGGWATASDASPPAERAGAGGADCRARGDRDRASPSGSACACASRSTGTSTGAIPAIPAKPSPSTGSCRRASPPVPIVWPTPQRIPVAHLANFGYEGETTLLTRITPPAALAAAAPVAITADVTWLVCEKECIPGEASLSLSLPVAGAGATAPHAAATASFDAARRALPQPSPWAARMQLAPDTVTLAGGRQGPDAGSRPLGLLLPLRRDAGAARGAATARRHARRPGPAPASAARCRPPRPTDAGGVLVVEEALGATTAAAGVRARQRRHRPGSQRLTRPHRSRPCCRPRSSPSSAASSST